MVSYLVRTRLDRFVPMNITLEVQLDMDIVEILEKNFLVVFIKTIKKQDDIHNLDYFLYEIRYYDEVLGEYRVAGRIVTRFMTLKEHEVRWILEEIAIDRCNRLKELLNSKEYRKRFND